MIPGLDAADFFGECALILVWIEHLQKEQAIEIVAEDTSDIPEWQKEAVRKTLVDVQQHPEQLQPWDIVKQKYKRP
jgi:TusA-related sulfurtransferase